jgi:hypothetical protein
VSAASAGGPYQARILVSDGSNGSWYIAYAVTGIATNSAVMLRTITAATLAISAEVSLGTTTATGNGGNETDNTGGICGYLAGNGDRVVFFTDGNRVATSNRTFCGLMRKYVYTGATTATFIVGGGWVASDPVQYNSVWYFMSGLHDAGGLGNYSGLQRGYYLRDSNGVIVCPVMLGSGASMGNSLKSGTTTTAVAGQRPSVDAGMGYMSLCHVTDLVTTGTLIINGSCINETSRGLVAGRTVIDMAPAFGAPAKISATAAMAPGGIPQVWSGIDAMREAAPMIFPWGIARTAGAAATYTSIAVCYVFTDADGTIWRSAPYLGAQTFGAADTLVVAPCLWKLAGTTIAIEIYGGTTTLRLIYVVANDATAETQTIVLPAAANLIVNGETLYTTGGALSNDPIVPATAVYAWRNRVFQVTPEQDRARISFSQELAVGFGPQFNSVLSLRWIDGSGECLAFGAVDWNYLCLFKIDAIGVISGPGPDGRGNGNYTTQKLPYKRGCSNTKSIVSGPAGCFFQDSQTGSICCVTPALQILEAAPAAFDWASEAITAAVHDETTSTMKFFTPNRIIVIDYRHPTEQYPLGEVFTHLSTGLLQAFGATQDATGLVHMEATGALRRPYAATYQDDTASSPASYGVYVETGWMQPFGMQASFSLREIQFLGEFRATADIRLTAFADFSASGDARTAALTVTASQFRVSPPGMMRINAVKFLVEELNSTGAGFDIEGFGLVVQSRAINKQLNTTQRL